MSGYNNRFDLQTLSISALLKICSCRPFSPVPSIVISLQGNATLPKCEITESSKGYLPRNFLVRSLLLDSLSSELERSSLSWFGFFLLFVAEKSSSGVGSAASTELFLATAPPPPPPPTFRSMTAPPFLGPLPFPVLVRCKLSRIESAMLIFCKLVKRRQ